MSWTRPEYKQFEPLPNAQRISVEEFAQSDFFRFHPERTFTAEIEVTHDDERTLYSSSHDDKQFMLVVAFLMYDGTGYAMKEDYRGKRVLLWRFGVCLHKHKTSQNVGRCLTKYTCTDCGFSETIDSSD